MTQRGAACLMIKNIINQTSDLQTSPKGWGRSTARTRQVSKWDQDQQLGTGIPQARTKPELKWRPWPKGRCCMDEDPRWDFSQILLIQLISWQPDPSTWEHFKEASCQLNSEEWGLLLHTGPWHKSWNSCCWGSCSMFNKSQYVGIPWFLRRCWSQPQVTPWGLPWHHGDDAFWNASVTSPALDLPGLEAKLVKSPMATCLKTLFCYTSP